MRSRHLCKSALLVLLWPPVGMRPNVCVNRYKVAQTIEARGQGRNSCADRSNALLIHTYINTMRSKHARMHTVLHRNTIHFCSGQKRRRARGKQYGISCRLLWRGISSIDERIYPMLIGDHVRTYEISCKHNNEVILPWKCCSTSDTAKTPSSTMKSTKRCNY